MNFASEHQRQFGNLIRFGTVSEVDHSAARCRVESGDVKTDWLPWIVPRAGETIEWSAPSVGEQVVLLCQDGETTGGVALRGIYSDNAQPPSNLETAHVIKFPDGAVVEYDHDSHALKTVLPGGGFVEITANGGVTITGDTTINGNVTVNGDVQVNGKITATVDVLGGDISLKNHKHPGVQAGGAQTGSPL